MILNNITFEYPYILLLIIVVIICIKFCKIKTLAIYFPHNDILFNVLKKQQILLNSLKIAILTLIIIALSSPIKTEDVAHNNSFGYEISLILDASGSMQQFNKFQIVKNIVSDFITKRKNDKLALSIFADFAYVAIPLTYDKKSIKRLLAKINVGIAGKNKTALYEALFLSSNLYKTSKSKEKIAILLTDGIDNANTVDINTAIGNAKKYKIKVYTVGIGNVGDFNPIVLQQIASQTGGKYFSANSVDKIQQVYDTINKLEKSQIDINKYTYKTYYFQYPLGLSLMMLLWYFILRNRK